MNFIFDVKKTEVLKASIIDSSPIFAITNFFKNLFLFLAVISLPLVYFSQNFKPLVILFALFLFCLDISLFIKLKLSKAVITANLENVKQNPEAYNLADFLDIKTIRIFNDARHFSKKRKFKQIDSTVILYSAFKISKEIAVVSYRLGINVEKTRDDAKNFLEKSVRKEDSEEQFSADFKKVIFDAMDVAISLGHKVIGEKEILVALAKNNDFFKKVLINFDLKEKDITDLTLWLDDAENRVAKMQKSWSLENLSRAGSMGKDWASGYTITLDQYSIDWRKEAEKWTYKQTVGHQKEIQQLEMVLARSSMANALIVGDPGTGRKSIVEALAQKCYLGSSLPELNGKRVVELDMVALLTRIQDPEKLETILDQIFQETIMAGNVILVIDEFHNFVGQDAKRAGAFDVSGILGKYLPLPNFQFIGITSFDGLHRSIEKNSSLLEYFRKIEVQEISETETIITLQNLALQMEAQHKIVVLYPAIREIVNLTARYFPSTPFPKKAIDILDEAVVYVSTLKQKVVLPSHIAKIISDKAQIPIGKMDFKEKEVLLNLENLIHERLVNQEEAVREISIAMRRARAEISSKKRPMGSFLFLGPTGVGKTETAKALAQIYFTSEEKMIRIDMSEFQAITDIPRLIGAISPIEMQGLLTTPVREAPFSLVLLDEIEKAHPNILNLFLQVLDEGHITDGQGRKVVFTNTIIIFTSNAGAAEIFKQVEAGEKLNKEKIIDFLLEKQLFKPEFINRFDATVIFHPLTKDNLLKIAQLTLQSLKKNLKEKEIDFEITEPLKAKIVQMSYKPEFGAREMRRVVQDNVENSIAEALLSDKLVKGAKFEIDPETFAVVISTPAE